jgi:hypothetical protein
LIENVGDPFIAGTDLATLLLEFILKLSKVHDARTAVIYDELCHRVVEDASWDALLPVDCRLLAASAVCFLVVWAIFEFMTLRSRKVKVIREGISKLLDESVLSMHQWVERQIDVSEPLLKQLLNS